MLRPIRATQRSLDAARVLARARAVSTGLVANVKSELDAMREAGTYKTERVITSSQQAHIKVERTTGEPLNMWLVEYAVGCTRWEFGSVYYNPELFRNCAAQTTTSD